MVEATQQKDDENGQGMAPLIRELLRPYRGSLAMILAAMLVQSLMTLSAPWPLKIIIDNVVVGRKLDPWIAALLKPLLVHGHRSHLAEIAALAVIVIAILSAAASYLANYLHRERRTVGGQRSAHADLSSLTVLIAALL